MDEHHLLIPLPLAELLYVTLGPLTDVLIKENHPWSKLTRMVLQAYREGRDRALLEEHGDDIVGDIDVVTFMVSEELCRWADSLAGEETDFDLWKKELGGEQ